MVAFVEMHPFYPNEGIYFLADQQLLRLAQLGDGARRSRRASLASNECHSIMRASIRMERAMGIEPTCEAWKASVLPLNYARLRPAGRDFGAAGPPHSSEPSRLVAKAA